MTNVTQSYSCVNHNQPLTHIFRDLAQRHIPSLSIRNNKAIVQCLFHNDANPSLSLNFEKAVFHCFGCGLAGGTKRFAELLGEPLPLSRRETPAWRAKRARLTAEQRTRTILQKRAKERDRQLCAEYRGVHADVVATAALLTLFHRRPDLAVEFSDVLAKAEYDYSEALFTLSLLEARLNGEVGE